MFIARRPSREQAVVAFAAAYNVFTLKMTKIHIPWLVTFV